MPEVTTEMDTDKLVTLIESRIGPLQALYLFGSVARKQERQDSDVDLAVLVASPLTELARWELAQELAVFCGKDVDLIDLRSASTVMRSQILHSSRKLYEQADAAPVGAFEDFIVSDYARLNEERAGILADIAARGSVHGG